MVNRPLESVSLICQTHIKITTLLFFEVPGELPELSLSTRKIVLKECLEEFHSRKKKSLTTSIDGCWALAACSYMPGCWVYIRGTANCGWAE